MHPQRIQPGPGQESVWDYPRPPRIELAPEPVRIIFNDAVIAASDRAQRVLETSHPPVYYIPPEDVAMEYLIPVPRRTFCEWKGPASYFTVQVGDRQADSAAWCYPDPTERFEPIRGYLAFYPSSMDACFVGEEQVQAQAGDFYGGWITSKIVGPFKGGTGTWGW
ncbi:hypothetical protein C7271_03565 [filamentous cyanobacterium CCP5]|nr:hypothetical protein C7271_03565 [filamentous cyanobacterium CCP5]